MAKSSGNHGTVGWQKGGEKSMKFFTPELYILGNSPVEDEVDRSEAEWERNTKRYHRHYRKIEPLLLPDLKRFHAEQSLHDADVFAPALLPKSAPWNGQEVVLVAQQINTLFAEYINTLAILQYKITAPPVVDSPVKSPVFHRGQPIWLYDEVDVVESGVFSHEILISDGRVIKILFSDFTYHIAPLILEGGSTAQPKSIKKPSAKEAG